MFDGMLAETGLQLHYCLGQFIGELESNADSPWVSRLMYHVSRQLERNALSWEQYTIVVKNL